MRSRVGWLIRGSPRSARETVLVATPAAAATISIEGSAASRFAAALGAFLAVLTGRGSPAHNAKRRAGG